MALQPLTFHPAAVVGNNETEITLYHCCSDQNEEAELACLQLNDDQNRLFFWPLNYQSTD